MDGAAEITQEPIAPGETFTYEFVTEQRGTYFYHSPRSHRPAAGARVSTAR